MKYIKPAAVLAVAFLAASCIKDEPLNTECDILADELPGVELVASPVVENTSVTFTVRYDQLETTMAPRFVITPGATIAPPSGTKRDFSVPQEYIITSEDGEWSKAYTVAVRWQPAPPEEESVEYSYNFENARIATAVGGRMYDVFYETNAAGEEDWAWASANSAYALTLQAKLPNEFPTYQAEGGIDGKYVVLVTKPTGSFGATVGKPMAAGNLYMGTFDITNALGKPLEATRFGMLFGQIPISFSGFYKYKAGETYCRPDSEGKLEPVPGKRDMFNCYAVFYESTPEMEWLDGTNVLSEDNPNIISTALIPDRHETDDWTEFSVPFVYREGKSVDPVKLKDGRYRLAVVMSSSQDGDYFCGAIGSTLAVDELSIVCKRNQDEE